MLSLEKQRPSTSEAFADVVYRRLTLFTGETGRLGCNHFLLRWHDLVNHAKSGDSPSFEVEAEAHLPFSLTLLEVRLWLSNQKRRVSSVTNNNPCRLARSSLTLTEVWQHMRSIVSDVPNHKIVLPYGEAGGFGFPAAPTQIEDRGLLLTTPM